METTCYPNCKINLGLRVMRRRTDGYHDIETIFYPVPLCDELSVRLQGNNCTRDTFRLDGIPLPSPDDDNLVIQVVKMLREEGCNIPPLDIRLKKNIPSGAGLGGGSSDAAYMMKTLNTMLQLGMSDTDMEQRVARLGADCAFFIKNTPVIASGIGNIFSATAIDLTGMWIWLVKPTDSVSTKEAYQGVHPDDSTQTLWPLSNKDICWDALVNDFEDSIFPHHPAIADLKETMKAHGAIYTAMSGSGATVFGLYKEKPRTETLPEDFFSFVTRL